MRRNRQAKIVATLGPASESPEVIRALFEAGADVFRFNFSHGSHADHAQRFRTVRALEREFGRAIAILTDLQGPKLRLGAMEGGRIELSEGARLTLDLDPAPGDGKRVPLPHPEIFAALEDGTEVLLDDGKLRLRVIEAARDRAVTEVVTGGALSNNKGVNVPNAVLPVTALAAKDRADLAFALDQGADYIGLSFVQRPEDIAEARRLIGGRASVLSKLEKPAAIEHLEEIITMSDAVMVARGDLGVELPPEDVPILQKRIIRACREQGKPVVVATQMLESMVSSPSPTRAEASDVAAAVYDGADAVMLSAETAAGKYPLEAVRMMNRIITRVERDPLLWRILSAERQDPEATSSDAITAAARQVAHTISAAAIVSFTTSGSTALRAARERPNVPILCLTERIDTARKLAIVWGLQCVIAADVRDFNDMVEKSCRIARETGMARTGQSVVITAGVPFGTPGATNVLRIAWVRD